MALEARYAARRDWPVERLVENLGALLSVRPKTIARQRITFLDTVDGRIARAGACLTLTADADGNRVQWLQGNQRLGCTIGGPLDFAWDIPSGALRQRIDSVVESRRLLPLAHTEQDGVLLDVLDETHKTVARLSIVAGRAREAKRRSPWQPYPPFLTLNALRGYDDQCTGPIAIVESRPGIERTSGTLQAHVLRAIGTTVPPGVPPYRVPLDPMVRTDAGSLRMHHELLRIVEAHHAGVVCDVDGVCLVDFRDGVARSRTLLGQIESEPPQADVEYLTGELAWLDQITAPTHELDRLLYGLRCAPSGLAEEAKRVLLAALEDERTTAHRALAAQLSGERYGRLIERWQALVSASPGGPTGEGLGVLPLMTTVSRRAWDLFQLTLAGIERVRSDTPANELCQIHDHATELRHLIDAAQTLYDADNLAVVLRALERLRTAVGEFNEARAQAAWLRQYGRGFDDDSGRDAARVRSAVEALADLAERRSAHLRKPMNQRMLRFGESATRNAFERVFHIKHLIELVQ